MTTYLIYTWTDLECHVKLLGKFVTMCTLQECWDTINKYFEGGEHGLFATKELL